jgi:hypothetical protein
MSLSGQLSTYPTGSRQYPYFHSGELSSAKAVVFLGGLTNGMMLPGYVVGLSGALARIGWGLCAVPCRRLKVLADLGVQGADALVERVRWLRHGLAGPR